MKYIDSEKLIAEINARIERCEKDEEDGYPDTTSSEATLKSILSLVTSLQQEQQEWDLDALVNEAFDKYSSIDGYGQLAVSFNRAELYSFIKKITRKEE